MRTIPQKDKKAGAYGADSLIRFEEGLIGFSDLKSFVLVESAELAPFMRLQSAERSEVGFLVIDPALVSDNYSSLIPRREWDSLGVPDPSVGITLAICLLGPTPADCTGNLQAPILVNYQKMVGRQIILTEGQLSARHPLR